MNTLLFTTIFSLVVNLFVSHPVKATHAANISPTPFTCSYDLRLSQAMEKLHNQSAVDILKKECLWLTDGFSADLQQSGKNDLVFWASGAGCGSCHTQYFYILSPDNKILFKDVLDDPQVTVTFIRDLNAFVIRQPVRKDNEPMGNPNQWYEKTYLWNASTNIFDKYDETTGFSATPTQIPSPTASLTLMPELSKQKLNDCLQKAEDAYNKTRADACVFQAKNDNAGYQNCMNHQLGDDFCASTWSNRNPSSNCPLPIATLNYLNNLRDSSKSDCYNAYYTGN